MPLSGIIEIGPIKPEVPDGDCVVGLYKDTLLLDKCDQRADLARLNTLRLAHVRSPCTTPLSWRWTIADAIRIICGGTC